METKTNKAIKLFKSGKIKEALSLFKTFKIGFTKDEKRTIEIAYESMTGRDKFYKDLGIDTNSKCVEAVEIITNKYK